MGLGSSKPAEPTPVPATEMTPVNTSTEVVAVEEEERKNQPVPSPNTSTINQQGGKFNRKNANKKLNNKMNKKMEAAMKNLEKAAKNYEKTLHKKNMSQSKELLMNTRAMKAMKSSEFQKKYAESCMKGECPAMTESCPPGEILREGYIAHKKSGNTMVMPSCIKNQGKPGKQGPSIVLRNDEDLGKFGYKNVKNLSKRKRQSALKRCVEEYGAEIVMDRLRALVNLRAGGSDPEGRAIFEEDLEYVYSHFPANYKTNEARKKQEKAINKSKSKKN